MVPAEILTLAEIPLTAQRQARPAGAARARPARRDLAGTAAAVPRRSLAEVWCEVLGLESVGAEDNFFESAATRSSASRSSRAPVPEAS